jgi:hypothetical protein
MKERKHQQRSYDESSLHELGILEQFAGNFTQAKALYEESLPISIESIDLYQVSNTKAQIGRIYQQQHNYPFAAATYAVAYKIMSLIESPNLPVVQAWISELRRSMGDQALDVAWQDGGRDPHLNVLRRIAVCKLCKRPVWPESLRNRSRYGNWCSQRSRHEEEWVSAFMAFSGEIAVLRRGHKRGCRIVFDYGKRQEYQHWKGQRSTVNRLLSRGGFAEIQKFFRCEDLEPGVPDIVTS